MNRLLFIKFLEDRQIVNINLLTGLYQKYESSGLLNISFYKAYLKQLFYEILNKEPNIRSTNDEIYKQIPYLNGGLFTKIIPDEDKYDLKDMLRISEMSLFEESNLTRIHSKPLVAIPYSVLAAFDSNH